MSEYRVTISRDGSLDEIRVDLSPTTTVDEFVHALVSSGYRPPFSFDGNRLGGSGLVNSLGLRNGSVVSSGRLEPSQRRIAPGPYLVVVAGPNSGEWAPLPYYGTFTIGRDAPQINLRKDARLSKAHADIIGSASGFVVRDRGSMNGTSIDGRTVQGDEVFSDGSYLVAGDSVLTLVELRPEDFATLPPHDGPTRPFPRRFRSARELVPDAIAAPTPPRDQSGGFGNSWWRALMPLVTGVGMAVITGRWIFLLMVAIAPIVFGVDAYRQKSRRDKKARDERAAYDHSLFVVKQVAESTRFREQLRARMDAPPPGLGVFWAESLHRRLWERRVSDPDFGVITIGLARRESAVALVESSSSAAPEPRVTLDAMPIAVSLLQNGSVGVVGRLERARGVIRGLLLSLATTHSPSELTMWLFAGDDAEEEWRCCRWLPHCQDDASARIAVTTDARSRQLSELRALIERRHENRNDRVLPIPIHVVVIDGALLLPTNLLTEILERGPDVGVVGIVIDPSVVPDGSVASLTISSVYGASLFESRHLVVTELRTSEVSTWVAEHAARRLASLRPSMTDAPVVADTSARLVDLVGVRYGSGPALAEQWAANGPLTRVAIGTTAETVLELDIVDGPHGLVGGMTRSGKTEFLKTLICGLALANHPDDLSFVIVDFKGGVDYELARSFPHVLDVSSNADLDRFERTVRMLGAERQRREGLFRSAGAANLNAYREARRRRPGLPPIPRLIVLVDEFGELTANEIGRGHLRALESIARVGGGLGINLLLITQNFSGNLPDQIDANASMRVCFRVQAAAHSKIVLSSPIAVGISSKAKGRGYLSIGGADPIEFQSARVAGRRSDLANAEDSLVRMQPDPFSAMWMPAFAGAATDVPSEETDMAMVVAVVADAAARAGWTTPAVPWPGMLEDNIALEAAWLMIAGRTGIPLGVEDLPDSQARAAWTWEEADDHLLLLGGGRADLNGALTTIAVSAALSASADDLHLYVIDLAGRGLGDLGDLPHCGTVSVRNDALSSRILTYLSEETSRRRSVLAEARAASLEELRRRTGHTFPRILLLIAGADRLHPSQGNETGSPLVGAVNALVAETIGLGIQIVMAGLPKIATLRPGSLIDRRLGLIIPTVSDYASPSFPRALLAELGPPRRAIDMQRGTLLEICTTGGGEVDESDAMAAFLERLDAQGATPLYRPPQRFVEVSWPFRIGGFLALVGSERRSHALPVAVANATGTAVWIDAAEDGSHWLVAGGPKSGRSLALGAIGSIAARLGWDVLASCFSSSSPLRAIPGVEVVDPKALAEAISAPRGRELLLLIDDVHRCDPAILGKLVDGEGATLTILSGSPAIFSGPAFRPYEALGLRLPKHGLLLAPNGSLDPFSMRRDVVRADLLASRRPGHGLISIHSELTEVTVPFIDRS